MQAVARRAGVAAGTVLYHYPTPQALAEAAITAWTAWVELPHSSTIDERAEIETRMSQLVEATFGMYDRSEWAYRILQKSLDYPPLIAARNEWESVFGQMIAAALGSHANDMEAFQVVSSLIDPSLWVTLRARGVAPERAVELVTALAVGWVQSPREPQAEPRRRGRRCRETS